MPQNNHLYFVVSLKENNQVIYKYCDAAGHITDESNPNGAIENIAGICNQSRNVFGLMPHPERVFRTVQMSWAPDSAGEDSPWMQLFYNARQWVD